MILFRGERYNRNSLEEECHLRLTYEWARICIPAVLFLIILRQMKDGLTILDDITFSLLTGIIINVYRGRLQIKSLTSVKEQFNLDSPTFFRPTRSIIRQHLGGIISHECERARIVRGAGRGVVDSSFL
jgi:hypothetical protein